MKKLTFLLLILFATASASGCGKKEDINNSALDPTPVTFTETILTENILAENVIVESWDSANVQTWGDF